MADWRDDWNPSAGDQVTFRESTSRKLIRVGYVERVIQRGKDKGKIIVRCGTRKHIVPKDEIRSRTRFE